MKSANANTKRTKGTKNTKIFYFGNPVPLFEPVLHPAAAKS
jgi:hypothetical protein